jgi:hypothetical protein
MSSAQSGEDNQSSVALRTGASCAKSSPGGTEATPILLNGSGSVAGWDGAQKRKNSTYASIFATDYTYFL